MPSTSTPKPTLKKTGKMHDKIADLFDSVFRPEVLVSYHHPDLRDALKEIDLKESMLVADLSHMTDETERENYMKLLRESLGDEKRRAQELRDRVKVPSVEFLLTKLKPTEHDRTNEAMRNATVAAMERLKPHRGKEVETLRQIIDPEGVYSAQMVEMETDGEALAEARHSAIEMVTEQILASAGQGAEWASVPEGDPDLYLSAAEEEMLTIDDRMAPEDMVAEVLNAPEHREQMIEEKRTRIREAREEIREKRKAALVGRGMDALLEILANYQILSKASQEGSIAQDDHELFYSVKDPSDPIEYQTAGGSKVSVSFNRYFSSVEEVEMLRENYSDLYYFLLEMYRDLQRVRTQEEVDRLARSALFR